MLLSCRGGNAFDQPAGGGDPAEPAVDPAQIPQRSFDFDRRASVRIKDFLRADPLHGRWKGAPHPSLDGRSLNVVKRMSTTMRSTHSTSKWKLPKDLGSDFGQFFFLQLLV